MQNPTAFQIVSIEPTESIVQVVNQTAQRHAIEVNVADSKQFIAPICGIEYHIQEVHLSKAKDGNSTTLGIESCLEEIMNLVEQELADGYIDVL